MSNTVAGIHLSGTAAGTPSAGSVTTGTLYSATDANVTYQSDGTATWSAWHTDRIVFANNGTAAGTAHTLSFATGTVAYSGGTATYTPPAAAGGGGGSVVFYDEGVVAGTAAIINVTGTGGTVTVTSGTAIIDIVAGGATTAALPVNTGTNAANTSSLAVTVPSGSSSNLFIAQIGVAQSTVSSITQTNVTWTQLAVSTNTTNTTSAEIWKGVPSGAPGTTVTVAIAAGCYTEAYVTEWAGLTGTLDDSSAGTGASGNQVFAAAPAILPGSSDALALFAACEWQGNTPMVAVSGAIPLNGPSGIGIFGYCWPNGNVVRPGVNQFTGIANWAAVLATIT